MKHFTPPPFRHRHPSPVGPHPLDHNLTEARRERFRQVLARRCVSLTVAVEDCWDPHNATAVIRTCDAMGVHRIHAVTKSNSFRINRRISQGSHLYTDIRLHKDIESAYAYLREHGFRILVSDLTSESVMDPHQLYQSGQSLALVFGNEERGLSREAIELADQSFAVPMSGFTQSLNLSVTVAVSLYSLRHRELAEDRPGDMSDEEQAYWYDLWIRRQVNRKKTPASRRDSAPGRRPEESGPPKDPRSTLQKGRRGESLESLQAEE